MLKKSDRLVQNLRKIFKESRSPRGFAARLSALPLKLYFACAYNPASYAGYKSLSTRPARPPCPPYWIIIWASRLPAVRQSFPDFHSLLPTLWDVYLCLKRPFRFSESKALVTLVIFWHVEIFASKMMVIKTFPPPTEGLHHVQKKTEAFLHDKPYGVGTLYIASE